VRCRTKCAAALGRRRVKPRSSRGQVGRWLEPARASPRAVGRLANESLSGALSARTG
jgi:hypothetical protein